ncbi:DUF4294 domain-containing protein [Bizionia paragorgiae]|uniref:DUF4294 domain-containing protein n=1 Tax=Bizionia paragorgiae TaxID=283786 RepID=A0A1H3XR31_BIZPA|nr:DUF4294 domain-containing protein [Bizionia paragorgiae]SEA01793.1 protein of unknown function [Bizionia paragorgiae]
MKINSILILFFLLWSPWCFYAQIVPVENDSIVMEYTLIDGDSIPVNAIDLNEVMLLHRLKFDNTLERRRYVILRRKTIKVYPYAILAAERLESLNERINSLASKRDKRVYARRIQKYIENEFSDELKKLTRTEGQILVKLVHRQTGMTTFDLIKDLRSGWRAFWFNTTATLFNISLKEEFDPVNVKEDYYIEDILERSFQSGVLKRQEPAIQFDFYELSNKWLK